MITTTLPSTKAEKNALKEYIFKQDIQVKKNKLLRKNLIVFKTK